ncbi:MAG TPA: dipeptidase [Vicinamibacteria bacterium]|nr:dipeptidase [Vicinamibacteria bacterium]
MSRHWLVAAIGLGAVGAAAAAIVPTQVEKRLNRLAPRPIQVSASARALHARLLVADLHADTLLWDRDLLRRGSRGHVDLPRLQEGGVALQAFTVVTKSPKNLNIERNDDRSDDITLLAVAQRWPPATWGSLRARALHQATRLLAAARRSRGELTLVRTAAELDAFIDRRRQDPRLVGAILGLEGSHALAGDLRNVDVLADAGFRMMAPTHFFDTDIGGSAHGVAKGGLTAKGRDGVRALEERKVLVDLAHASPQTIDDVLALARRPVVVSHTGVRGTCDNRRNLGDAQLQAVARTGGVVGIGFWDTAVCGDDARAVARAIAHAVRVAGPEHVGLGSDFDGAVTTPFDASGLPQVTQALLDAGMAEDDVARVMGGNVIRLLRQTLPGGR